MQSIAEEIEKLNTLKEKGVLSEEEFQSAKADLLAKEGKSANSAKNFIDDMSSDTSLWTMLIHLTQFAGYIVPGLGMVIPIVMWQIKKNESEVIDRHGQIVANWILSVLIYIMVGMLLTPILIGFLILVPVTIMGIVFPIIGGIKAQNGDVWVYPFSLTFFKPDSRIADTTHSAVK